MSHKSTPPKKSTIKMISKRERKGGGGADGVKGYSTVKAPPIRLAAITMNTQKIWVIEPSIAFHPGIATPFAEGGKVVPNTFVGSGPPDTVIVGFDESGEVLVAFELPLATIENLGDVAKCKPWVELSVTR